MERIVLVCLGGALGTGLRYATGALAARWLGPDFPYGTLIVNVVGSFLIGLIQEVGTTSPVVVSESTRLFLTVGIMGGLTTYSAYSYETVRLTQSRVWGTRGSTSWRRRRSAWRCASWAWRLAAGSSAHQSLAARHFDAR
jgi:CrcB protein